jgi:flagellar basal-body rod protein FlgF
MHNYITTVICLVFMIYSNLSYAFDITSFVMLSKQRTLLDNLEVVSNNVANSETIGFREVKLLEREFIIKYPNTKNNIYNNDISTIRNTQDGPISKTDSNLDLAIIGNGFFMVKTPDGIRLTRAGNFTLSADKNITTLQGFKLLDNSQSDITIDNQAEQIYIDKNAEIFINNEKVTQIAIVTIKNLQTLKATGQNLFEVPNSENIIPSTNFTLLQGYIESSNVNKIKQMTNLIEIQRDVTAVTGLLDTYNNMTNSSVTTLGKPN